MQMKLIHESFAEALDDVVKACGGYKKVGVLMWPELETRPDAAANKLRDHFDEHRREKLSLEQIVMLMRLGRTNGVHVAMDYLADYLGYTKPVPVSTEDAEARLVSAIESASGQLAKAMRELEMVRARHEVGVR